MKIRLSRHIAAAIALLGLKSMEVARACGKSENHISDVINGKVKPSPELMAFLSESGIDVNWILTGRGSPYAASTSMATETELPHEDREKDYANPNIPE